MFKADWDHKHVEQEHGVEEMYIARLHKIFEAANIKAGIKEP